MRKPLQVKIKKDTTYVLSPPKVGYIHKKNDKLMKYRSKDPKLESLVIRGCA